MAVSDWRERLESITRPDDGERIGYLRQAGEDQWEPLNLLGIAVGEIGSRDDALGVVKSHAMASLIEPWWCRVHRPLTEPLLDARAISDDAEWDRMVVAELTLDRALMRPMYAWPEEAGYYLAIDLPADDMLFRKEPVDAI